MEGVGRLTLKSAVELKQLWMELELLASECPDVNAEEAQWAQWSRGVDESSAKMAVVIGGVV